MITLKNRNNARNSMFIANKSKISAQPHPNQRVYTIIRKPAIIGNKMQDALGDQGPNLGCQANKKKNHKS